ncbi:hypothetical protein JQK88_30655 [Mesorhizobium caraganae]|uniref:hypothetical protein n=1 Tax=Mesorhizobium caraganae TaxID=483206 RepID=UPI00193ABAEF|nr:hypothetical protein [Mesorhizobium caraganae]MBM2715491.1 hypothetical protein [Mesorhizobium caraganae]
MESYAIEKELSPNTEQPVWALYHVREDGTRGLVNRFLGEEQALYMQTHWMGVLQERKRYRTDPVYRRERDAADAREAARQRRGALAGKIGLAVVISAIVGLLVWAGGQGGSRGQYDDDDGCSVYWRC